ncbi:protein-L-isoaspartate O-methyltransferase family protein [Embleya sp. MST-111070]|uniref:protein-L-isoaspartate O-methyltransferase family protein n=1 Tax=Embleya sp. MST-111070 TaxID=3398231 RepID=UPI003F73E4A6
MAATTARTINDTTPTRPTIVDTLKAADALPPGWEEAFTTVDRAAFVPDRVWPFDLATGTYAPVVDRTRDPRAWHRAATGPDPLVTQWDDGAHTGDAPGTLASSSVSAPAAVAALLGDLDAAPGMRVLDVGTGTGYTAELLAARGCTVTTVEIDPDLADRARANLTRAGYADRVTVITADATTEHPATAPFDRIHITAGVRRIPPTWLARTRPGGIVVMPWGTDYSPHDWALRLTVTDPHHAAGPFTRALSFMKSRRPHAFRVPARRERSGGSAELPPGDALDTGRLSLGADWLVCGVGWGVAVG